MTRMRLIDDLIESVKKNNAQIRDIRVGLSWAGVHGERCGIAMVYESRNKSGNYASETGYLTEETTLEVANHARSWNLVEAGVGVAAINSMTPRREWNSMNAFDIILEKAANKTVTMVGAFPFSERVRAIAEKLWILELDPDLLSPAMGIIPAAAAEYVIPGSDMVVITGSAMINKSMERLLDISSKAGAYTIVMGPSTPMSEVLFDYGANLLAGVNIVEPEAVMRRLSRIGGLLSPKNCPGQIEFITMEK